MVDDDIDRSRWRDLIERNPFASPFQTFDFYCFCKSVSGFSAKALAIEFEGKLDALAVITIQAEKGIKGYFSHRGIIYGGPLFNSSYPDSFAFLLENIDRLLKRKVIYLESRNLFNYSSARDIFDVQKWAYIPYLNFQLETIDSKDLIKRVSNSRMRQIKKAYQAGVQWKAADSLEDISNFYEILKKLYKLKIKKPLPGWEFFKVFYEKKVGVFLLVYYKGNVIGGMMCPIQPEKTIYEFYICGLDDQYKEQYPSVMATWAAIEYALNNKIKCFNFMGAGKLDEAYGVREFKARFGGELVEHGRFIKIFKPTLYNFGKTGLKLLAKISG